MDLSRLAHEIQLAEGRIRPHTLVTPLSYSETLSERTGGQVYFKKENLQHTGSFKARGSLNKILSLTKDERTRGVISASTGNHGLGVARGLQIAGVEGTIYLPTIVTRKKIEALRAFGARLEIAGNTSLEAELFAKDMATKTGAVWISPYNDLQVMAGQGTIGLELLDQQPDLDVMFATVGGGGLMSGIAGHLKSINPAITIIGCWPENSPEMYRSIQAGHVVDVPEAKATLSEASAGAMEQGAITFDYCRALIDEYVLVPEAGIAAAMKLVYEETGEMVEGSAGVAVAACLKMGSALNGKKVAVVLCGGNISADAFEKAMMVR
ncbi:MAG: threonine/serine dehydratase [Saprospiraceae bacterium]|nr:threonine/serine dehydratase [Saprospiraceae bacterium]